MDYSNLISIDDSKWFAVIKSIKKQKPIIANPIIIGFDTEFITRHGKQELLSIQLATNNASCLVVHSLVKSLGSVVHPDNYAFPASIDTFNLGVILSVFLQKYAGLASIPDNIYLVSHFCQAEISNISNLNDIQLFQYNKALCGKLQLTLANKQVTIHFIDLFGLLPTSLEKIGHYIGIPKISLAGIGGKPESYWYENMDELYTRYPDVYRDYSLTDALIAYHAYTKIRDFFITQYSVDILHFSTLPSIASYIFRSHYINDGVVPTRIIQTPRKQKKTLVDDTNKYYSIIQKEEIFAGDLNIRYASLQAYHGARVESFYRGRIENTNLAYYDVVSLYPSSCMLQPLPVKDTKWHNLSNLHAKLREKLLQAGEGFVEVEFSFPEDTMYPCLPVSGVRDGVLYFPLSGVSYCTLAEFRLALKLGLKAYKILSGYAFLPSSKERKHPLRNYMETLLQLKNASPKGSIEYELYKLLMNALVGKLVQRNEDTTTLELIRDGYLPREAYNRVARKLTSYTSVGNLWYPEWASLILGKARAIISEFVAKGAYFVSTDSVLLPVNTDISCDSLNELRSVGSDLKLEFIVTHGILIRSRLYALNPQEDNPDKRHIARHGVHCNEERFLQIMREGYLTGEIPDLSYQTVKLIKYHEFLRRGIPLNTPYYYESSINIRWDGKRNLILPVENPFRESSWSKPLTSLEVITNRVRMQSGANRKARKKQYTENQLAIINLLQEGYTQTKIAKELGLSKGYISKVAKQISKEGVNNARYCQCKIN